MGVTGCRSRTGQPRRTAAPRLPVCGSAGQGFGSPFSAQSSIRAMSAIRKVGARTKKRVLLRAMVAGMLVIGAVSGCVLLWRSSPSPALDPEVAKAIAELEPGLTPIQRTVLRTCPSLESYFPRLFRRRASRPYPVDGRFTALGDRARPAVPILLRMLASHHHDTRWRAFTALLVIQADPAAVAAVLQSRPASRDEFVLGVAWSLGQGANFTPPRRCEWGWQLLAALGPAGTNAIPALVDNLRLRQRVEHSLAALGGMGTNAASALPVILALLNDPAGDYQHQAKAAAAIGQIGVATEPVMSSLRLASANAPSLVRARAAGALGRLGAPTEEVLRVLNQTATHKLATVRAAALEELAALGPAGRLLPDPTTNHTPSATGSGR